jgi:predicted nucleic acid-binding protein
MVLDTNVVLDCLLFRDPECAALNAALSAGEVRWIATAAMREELAHVLARRTLDKWRPDLPALWAYWQEHCLEVPVAPPLGPGAAMRCSDPDDQKFIDLAVARQARWLLSHDRAVLKLARRLHHRGIAVTPPAAWAMHHATP